MGPSRLKGLILVGLSTIVVLALYRTWPAGAGSAADRPGTTGTAGSAAPEQPLAAADLRLEALTAARDEPGAVRRNLFQFDEPAPSAPSEPAAIRQAADTAVPRPPLPTVAPIPLKFIGIVEAPERSLVIAVLSDERGVYHGREGETVEGRYRIWRISAESVEVSHLDGSGRQTIRLSGS
jgi:hypothetical protein